MAVKASARADAPARSVRALPAARAAESSAYKGMRNVRLASDGTAEGAKALLAAQVACRQAGASCRVDFHPVTHGAQVLIEETP